MSSSLSLTQPGGNSNRNGGASESEASSIAASLSTSSLSSRRPPQLGAIQTRRAQASFRPSTKVVTSLVSNHGQQQHERQEHGNQQQQQPLVISLPHHPSQRQQQPSSLSTVIPLSSSSSSSPLSTNSPHFSRPPLPLSHLQPHHSATTTPAGNSSVSPLTASPLSGTPGIDTFPPYTPSTVVTAHSPTAGAAAMTSYTAPLDSTDTSSHPRTYGDNINMYHAEAFKDVPLSPTSHASTNEKTSSNFTPNNTTAAAAITATSLSLPPASSSFSPSPSPSSSSPSPIVSPSSIPRPLNHYRPPTSSSSPGPSPVAALPAQSTPFSSRSSSPRHKEQGSGGKRHAAYSSTAFSGPETSRRGSAGTDGNASSTHLSLGHSNHNIKDGGEMDGSNNGDRYANLPTLWQVLHRKTLPPVCLFNFYLYMRDHERSSEQVDFWLDVTTHEVLWRLYVRTLRRKEARERAEERQLMKEREEKEREQQQLHAAAVVPAGQQRTLLHKIHKSQSSLSLEMLKPHWTVAKRFLDMSEEERQEYGKQTGMRWEDVKDVMLERAQLEETHKQIERERQRLQQEDDVGTTTNSKSDREEELMADQDEQRVTSLEVQPRRKQQPPGSYQVQHLRLDTSGKNNNLRSKDSSEPIMLAGISHQQDSQQQSSSPSTQKSYDMMVGESSTSAAAVGLAATRSNNIHPTSNGLANGEGTTAAKTAPDCGSAKGLSGMAVTREEVLRSAERIYLKYLAPQAEKHIHIPPSVRQQIAMLIEGYLMSSNQSQTSSRPPSEHQQKKNSETGVISHGEATRSATTGSEPGSSPSSAEKKESFKGVDDSPSTKDPRSEKRGGSPVTDRSQSSTSNYSSKRSMKASAVGGGNGMTGRSTQSDGSFTMYPQPDQDLGLAFAEAREIVFSTMERYYFPRFLRARAYGNMVHVQRVFRLFLGLFFLFLGFTTVLCLIFLNARPRSKRAWALIPIFSGAMLCTTFQFNICPILAALNLSENKLMHFAKNKEPYIIGLHRRRALKVIIVAILYTASLGIVFGVIPGHRL